MENCDCPFLITALGNMLLKLLKRNYLKMRELFSAGGPIALEEEEKCELIFFCGGILNFVSKSDLNLKNEIVRIKEDLYILLFQNK